MARETFFTIVMLVLTMKTIPVTNVTGLDSIGMNVITVMDGEKFNLNGGQCMKYIYESPDNGKTVYRTPIGVPHAKRELVNPDEVFTTLVPLPNGEVKAIVATSEDEVVEQLVSLLDSIKE